MALGEDLEYSITTLEQSAIERETHPRSLATLHDGVASQNDWRTGAMTPLDECIEVIEKP